MGRANRTSHRQDTTERSRILSASPLLVGGTVGGSATAGGRAGAWQSPVPVNAKPWPTRQMASPPKCSRGLACYDPGRRRANVQLDGPDFRHLHRRPDGADPVDGRQRGRRQHGRPVLRHGHFLWRPDLDHFSQAATTGTYNWNTADVPAGTYYIGGYLYSGGTPYYSHLTQSITIQAARRQRST